ncbi:hypothetical protein DBW_1860 [Desulfuromonas sp. DDH964]|nr:hypothetical protein DBW_1860 [Desulfuromonas sp. DDH964]
MTRLAAPSYSALLDAAREFKYLIDIQKPGIMICPAAGGKWKPISESDSFRKACAVLEAADFSSNDSSC